MANQSIPNSQITTYTHNGFRTDVNKVAMPFGSGVPLQNVYNFLVSPVLDSGDGSICAKAVFNAAGQPLNPNPQAPGAIVLAAASNLFSAGLFATLTVGSKASLNPIAANFSSKILSINLKFTMNNTQFTVLTVTGQIAPGVTVFENLTFTKTGDNNPQDILVPTKYAYISVSSVVIQTAAATLTAIAAPTTNPTQVQALTNTGVASLLVPPVQTGLVLNSFLTLNTTEAASFPAQNFLINLTSTGDAGNVTLRVIGANAVGGALDVNVTFNALNGAQSVAVGQDFASVTSIQVTALTTQAGGPLTASIAIQVTDVSVIYRPINGNNMSQLDCQRCVVIALIPDANQRVTQVVQVLITGYDDRLVQVQETLTIPSVTLEINTAQYFTSNKAYSYIQSIVLSNDPSPVNAVNVSIAVSASNQFFGLPFYFLSDGIMTVTPPDIAGLNAGILNAAVQPGNNFYAKVPSATRSVSLNTYDGNTNFSISNLDARGIIALSNDLYGSNNILSYVAYIYAADSFINAQLQNAPTNPMAQQQISDWVTGTQGAVTNSPTYQGWTNANWATTSLIDFDLTGAQFPGDQAQFNQIFNNSSLPKTVVRRMGPALTAPSTT